MFVSFSFVVFGFYTPSGLPQVVFGAHLDLLGRGLLVFCRIECCTGGESNTGLVFSDVMKFFHLH